MTDDGGAEGGWSEVRQRPWKQKCVCVSAYMNA